MKRVYAYYCKPPQNEAHAAIIDQIIRDGHAYYNSIIALQRPLLAAEEQLRRELIPELRDLERKAKKDEDAMRIAAATKKTPAYIEFKSRCAELRAGYFAAKKALYNESPCHWGTKLRQEQAAELAYESSRKEIYLNPELAGKRPHFRRWHGGTGLLAAQIQKGMPTHDLLSNGDSRASLEMTGRGRAVLRLSLGRLYGRVELPIRYHRDLPPARIQWIVVTRQARNPVRNAAGEWRMWYDYQVQFTVDMSDVQAGSGVCGVNLGTGRRLDDGRFRVAYARGNDGQHHELVLTDEHLALWSYAESLQGFRDVHFNRAKLALAAWVADERELPLALKDTIWDLRLRLQDGEERIKAELDRWEAWRDAWQGKPAMPEWLRRDVATAALWKSHERLVGLIESWRTHRFPGDEPALEALGAWRTRENHLLQLEVAARGRALRRRLDIFRNFAAELAERYGTIAVEDSDYAELRLRPAPEDAVDEAAARARMNESSPGLLREVLLQKAARGIKVPGEGISLHCARCGQRDDWDRKAELRHTCSRCGHDYDQDANAAEAVMARGEVVVSGLVTARETQADEANGDANGKTPRGGRWAKRKQKALAARTGNDGNGGG